MTQVKWNPVQVNARGEIVRGDTPEEDSYVWITIVENGRPFVCRSWWGDGMPCGDYVYHRFWEVDEPKIIKAWAFCEEPEPYKGETNNDK